MWVGESRNIERIMKRNNEGCIIMAMFLMVIFFIAYGFHSVDEDLMGVFHISVLCKK